MKRIQRKRTRGWRMPQNAVYVGRPTTWANPYRVTKTKEGWAVSLAGETLSIHPSQRGALIAAVALYRNYVAQRADLDEWLAPLKGKDLACWCPLDMPCHADILIKLIGEQCA